MLKNSRIAVLGFGAQGKAECKNLSRSNIDFVVGVRPDGASAERARAEGYRVVSMREAVEWADSIALNLPDHIQASIYKECIEPASHIRRIVFAHGFNTHFKLIPVQNAHHLLVAPKGAASGLVEYYKTPQALPAILGIQSKESAEKVLEEEKKWAEAYALAIGCHPKGLIWATFADETECDLFSEQAFLCGGVPELLKQAYEVMVEAGYNPETAYFESLFELKLIVDLIWREGISGMQSRISPTARYGGLTRGPRVINAATKDRLREALKEIQTGAFSKEFLAEVNSNRFKELENRERLHPIEQIGKILRERLRN